tara:strand:+ start:2290 stop:2733 length:444 start_codon:yes stop_codon:yes gene_type:complete
MYTKKNGRMTYKSNRRPNFKRNNNYSSKGRNKGNVTQQYNKYLKLAKDTFSAGDRIQAEYYYQFTDHYYRLMQELGINLDDQDSSIETKDITTESVSSEEDKDESSTEEDNPEDNKTSHDDDDVDHSIESIPFISEPVKKKRTRSSK